MALLMAGSRVAVGQSLDSLLERSSFSERERTEVINAVERAVEARVPVELLLPRVAEAIAKRVSVDGIVASVERDRAMFVESRRLLLDVGAGELVSNHATWARTANLLRAGVPAFAVQRLAGAVSTRPELFRPASILLVSLYDWGISADDAADLASATTQSVLSPEQYPIVLDLLIGARSRRIPLRDAVELLIDSLPVATSLREIRRTMESMN